MIKVDCYPNSPALWWHSAPRRHEWPTYVHGPIWEYLECQMVSTFWCLFILCKSTTVINKICVLLPYIICPPTPPNEVYPTSPFSWDLFTVHVTFLRWKGDSLLTGSTSYTIHVSGTPSLIGLHSSFFRTHRSRLSIPLWPRSIPTSPSHPDSSCGLLNQT